MLDIGAPTGSDPKCYFAACRLSQKIDDKQLPTKKKPFSTINAHAFNHGLTILCPTSQHTNTLRQRLQTILNAKNYAKVHLKPSQIVTGDFFNKYIKTGNVLLLSEGRPGIDNRFSLHEGILRIELDKETYERAGLQGSPIPTPGRKHVAQRFLIELNLRLPSMLRGRKLFNRMIYAFENTLSDSLTWLFYDLVSPQLTETAHATQDNVTAGNVKDVHKGQTERTEQVDQRSPPIMVHSPFVRSLDLIETLLPKTKTPASFPLITDQTHEAQATELLEWLHLAITRSPRLNSDDEIDSFLSRYRVPDLTLTGESNTPASAHVTADLTLLTINAFMPSSLITALFTATTRTMHQHDWFAIKVDAFDTSSSYTLFVQQGTCMIWQCD